jgi:hypothetical protein
MSSLTHVSLRTRSLPRAALLVETRAKRRELLDDEKIQMDVPDLLTCHIVEYNSVEIRQQTTLQSRRGVSLRYYERRGIDGACIGNEGR